MFCESDSCDNFGINFTTGGLWVQFPSAPKLFKIRVLTHISGVTKLGFQNSGSKLILKARNWRS